MTTRPIIRDFAGNPVFSYSKGAAGPRNRKRASPEADLQRAVMEYLTFALSPDLYRVRAGVEGARRGFREAANAKRLGLARGWPDLMLLNRKTRAVRWIELKADKGSLTPAQREIAADLGDHMAICRSLEEVEAALLAWGVTPRVPLAKANRYAT